MCYELRDMISIIIPVYKQADKLAACLESILRQSFKDYEVIVVNDGSPDNVKKAAQLYKDSLPLSYYELPFNHGAPAARNFGCQKARGDYLFFCDADAVLKPEALSSLYNTLLASPLAGYAYSSFIWGRKLFKVGEFRADKLKSGPFIHTMSLIRRTAFPAAGWDEKIKKFQDWDLWLTMLAAGQTGVWLNQVLFTIKPGGVISQWLPSFFYKIFPFLPAVKKYRQAMEIIKQKHSLP